MGSRLGKRQLRIIHALKLEATGREHYATSYLGSHPKDRPSLLALLDRGLIQGVTGWDRITLTDAGRSLDDAGKVTLADRVPA